MVILAFSTLEMGQPVSAAWAAFRKAAWSAFGTRAFTSRWAEVMAKPESSFSGLMGGVVSMLSAAGLAGGGWAGGAVGDQGGCAARRGFAGVCTGALSQGDVIYLRVYGGSG